MSVKVENTENKNEVKLTFNIESEKFDEAMKKVYAKTAKYFNIPGFRKGKAPMQLVERQYGSAIFYEDAFNELVPDIYDEAIKENKIEAVSRPNIDIVQKFLSISSYGISDYELFSCKLKANHQSSELAFRGKVEITWGNSQISINTTKKFGLLISSPPYGDNHTTVTYGQTSYLPLQWIPSNDIECPYDYLRTTQEIDRQSLGGKINNKNLEERRIALFEKTKHLRDFYKNIPNDEIVKYKKTIAFIADFDDSLRNIMGVMNDDAYYIWTIGNRFVGGREIPNAEILQDLMEYYGINLFFKAERQILNKKQANKNNYSKTMEKEQIMIFHREN